MLLNPPAVRIPFNTWLPGSTVPRSISKVVKPLRETDSVLTVVSSICSSRPAPTVPYMLTIAVTGSVLVG